MTTNLFDSARIELTCPNCGHKFSELLGKLKTEPTLTCAGCGGSIAIDAKNLNAGLKQADSSVEDFRKSVASLSKKIKL